MIITDGPVRDFVGVATGLSTGVVPLEVLESELVGLAGHLAAGHCRWLRMLSEFDTRQGWAGPALRSCAHWLSWRVGMSLRTGLEQLRVAHALSDLPAVTEAFAAGRISYSKVRAITRVATPATETALLDIALAGTASHVERVVRHARQAGSDPVTATDRELQWRWDDDGMLILRGKFTAEQGTELIAAINHLTAPPSSERAAPACSAGGPELGDEDGGSSAGSPGSPSPCDTDVEEGAHSSGRSKVHRPARAPGARPPEHGDTHDAPSIAARRADALMACVTGGRRAEAQLMVVVEAGSGSLTSECSGTCTGSGSGLRPDHGSGSCECEMSAGSGGHGAGAGPGGHGPSTGSGRTGPVTGTRRTGPVTGTGSDSGLGSEAGSAYLQGGPAIPMRTAERIGCNARVRALVRDRRGNPLHLGRTRRLASPAQIATLQIRDKGRCRFPGCEQTRHLEAHHIVHWLRGGRTDLANLMLICGHHHRQIHDHGYIVRGRGTEATFHRPDECPIEPFGSPTSGNVEALRAGNGSRQIDGDTITPYWAGERLDLDAALAGLFAQSGSAEVV